ncbi:RNA polymerase II elongation factor Ell [Hetaerina americana]|uniref:RNA polymerase II elongation factor Ell n=1 Tax=Hetaerina americana TaxID=62018 RepID=UPI003A7F3982
MAALVAGVQYGLSSQGNFHENKSLIFVKLTDSAYRAIDDYLKNKNKTSQQPKIQFLGNEGQLSFPSPQNGHGPAFHFSLSGNEDIEGPQGSFECLQSKSKSFECMGALPCKMRIQANEDVYAATKHRMAVAEEQHKKNCTQVIKASGPDIGRKVKVKKVGGIGALPKRETSPPSYRAIGPPLSAMAMGGGGAHKPRSSANSFANCHDTSNNDSSNGNHLDAGMPHLNTISNGPSIPGGGRVMGGAGKRGGGSQDIWKRPIKERLIHLLALRPFKKPELYDRIRREGFRGEKNALVSAIQQVAFMNGNTYHLIRSLWNDVQEDWPFYSEQDRQVLKRRKPQNLTPPGSDGSSGSGHSPTSTHPGSPPPAISPAVPSPANGRLPTLEGAPGAKRPGYYDGADGIITKRQRISHFKRTTGSEWPLPSSVTANSNSGGSSGNNNINNNSSNCNNLGSGTQQPQQPRNRVDTANRRPPPHESRPTGGSPGHHPPSSRHQRHSSPAHGCRAATTARPPREEVGGESATAAQGATASSHSPEGSAAVAACRGGSGGRSGGGVGVVEAGDEGRGGEVSETVRDKATNHSWPGGKSVARLTSTSPEEGYTRGQERVTLAAPGGRGGGQGRVVVSAEVKDEEVESDRASSEYPDYLTEYTRIMTAEQRNKYKADFNADYSEYRELHAVVEMVSRRFAILEERLLQKEKGSEEWNTIKDQIVREYQENKRDQQYPEAKKKFQYLHEKLSHIKRLVLEYDSSNVGQVAASVHHQKH